MAKFGNNTIGERFGWRTIDRGQMIDAVSVVHAGIRVLVNMTLTGEAAEVAPMCFECKDPHLQSIL
jgi:hypothetical protein